MSSSPWAECLLFVVKPAEAPDGFDGLKGYLLVPGLDINARGTLCSILATSEVQLIQEECPQDLIAATKNGQVEFVNHLLDLKSLQLGKSEVCIAPVCLSVCLSVTGNRLLERILAKGFVRFVRHYTEEALERFPHSVFRDESCLATICQVLELNPNIRCWNSPGETFLHLAVSRYCERLVRYLLEHGAKTDIRWAEKDETALHFAIRRCRSDTILDLILKKGADPIAASNGVSPLLLALREPSCNVARLVLLLNNGADVDANWEIVLQTAVERGPEYVGSVLRSRPNWPKAPGQQALRSFLKRRCMQGTASRMVEIFLEHGIDLVPEDAEDTELLFGAIKLDRYDLVEKLLVWGASVHEQFNGMNALHVAANYAREEIVRLLLDNGADVHARTSSGETPLSLAISAGIPQGMKRLVTSGSKTSKYQLQVPAHQIYKAPPGTLAIVRALIEAGADVSTPCGAGGDPIMTASRFCRVEVMEELWRHGVRMNFDSDVVRHDFRLAILMGAMSAVKFYMQNGVELKDGMIEAIKTAIISHNKAMVQFCMEFDDPCSRTFESGDVLEKAMCSCTFVKDVLESYTSLKPIFAVLQKDASRSFPLHVYENKVLHHVSVLMAAELRVNQHVCTPESLAKFFGDSSSSPENLKHEVQSMKDVKIGDSDVTFYDVLNSPLSEVVRLLRNTSIVEVLQGGDFGADFPSYTGMITKRFRRALFRKTLAEQGIKMIHALWPHLPKLPHEVKENIVNYLSNQNLYVLTNVCQLPEDDIVTTQSSE